jgi:hypothetical protein
VLRRRSPPTDAETSIGLARLNAVLIEPLRDRVRAGAARREPLAAAMAAPDAMEDGAVVPLRVP